MSSEIQQTQDLLLRKEMSCEEFITQKLVQIENNIKNSTILPINSWKNIARLIDEKIRQNKLLNVLEGIWFWVKDVFLVEWTITSAWSKILSNYIAPYTATVVQKLLDSWAILLAKENCDSFGHGSTNENSHYWFVKNAFDNSLVSWWSSWGSAVNVAIKNTVFSIGEDTGWSIRQPASYNQVVWFKPSYGTVSRHWVIAYASSLDTVWPIANSVKDIAIVMDVIAWKDPKDATSREKTKSYVDHLESINWKGKRIWYYKSFMNPNILDKEIFDNIQNVINECQSKWAKIIELESFDHELLVATYYIIAMAESASNLSRIDWTRYGLSSKEAKNIKDLYLKSRGEWFSEETKRRIVLWNQVLSQGYAEKYYTKARVARQKLIEQTNNDFNKVDMIISPVTAHMPPKIWESLNDPIKMYMSDVFTVWFSLSKIPTIALPIKWFSALQLSTAYAEDYEAIRYAYNIELLIKDLKK